MASVQLYLLGSFELRCAGQVLPAPPTIKSQSLLAYLALHRDRPQPRDRLQGLLWAERPERRARRSLSTALWQIRRCLPAGYLWSDHHHIEWLPQSELWLDVETFEQQAGRDDLPSLQSAVALYRGDFLDGFFDDWAVEERHRLQTLLVQTLARLVQAHEAGGEHGAALATALRLLAADSLREEAYQAAMRAYCRLGQRAAALAQYRRCQEILAEELGVEPLAETTALYQDIVAGRFAYASTAVPVAVAPAAPAGRDPLDAAAVSPFVGREIELAFLEERWREAQAGKGPVVLIPGEAGVGKTRLVQELARRVRWSGGRVLAGRCYEFERLLPYQPVAEALRAALPLLSPADLQALPPWAAAEVARLLPELAEHYPDLPPPIALSPDQEQARLFDGLVRFLSGLASHGPLLLVLEDLHWAGESTLQLLHYLARRLARQPILFLATLRPEEVGPEHPARAWQQQLLQEGRAQALPLRRLAAEAVAQWVLGMSGGGEAVRPLAGRLYQETEGNSFFLAETIKALFQEGRLRLEEGVWQGDFAHLSQAALPLPATLSEAIEMRVSRLSAPTQKAVRVAAVLGREFDLEPLARAWAQGEEAALAALDELLRGRLVEEGGGALGRDYSFAHHKVQEVVYTGLPPRRRQRLHARVEAALEELAGSAAGEIAGELAHHLLQARAADPALTAKAVDYLRQAGERARARYANAEAAAYFSQALELTPAEDLAGRYDLLLAREQVHDRLGAREAQRQDLAALRDATQALGDVHGQVKATLLQAAYAQSIGDYRAEIAAAKQVICMAERAQDGTGIAAGHLRYGIALFMLGRLDASRRQLARALVQARRSQDRRVEAHTLHSLSELCHEQGDLVNASTYAGQALEIHRREADTREQCSPLNVLGLVRLYLGDYAGARLFFEQVLDTCRQIGLRMREGVMLDNIGLTFSLADPADCARAKAYSLEALEIHRECNDRISECFGLNDLALACLEQNDYAQAQSWCEQSLRLQREVGSPRSESWALVLLCAALLHMGNYGRARRCGEEALRIAQEVGLRTWESWALCHLGLLAHDQGDDALACTQGREALRLAQEVGFRYIAGLARCTLGHALAGLGRLDEAAAVYREALLGNAEAGWCNRDMVPLAGLAAVALAQGDTAGALAHVEEVLRHLATHNLDTTREPLWIYLTCYRVLRAAGDLRAGPVLATAHGLLQEWAARIEDPELRRSFLENVAVNREIGEKFAASRLS